MVPVHKLGLRLVGTKNLSKIEMPTKILYRALAGGFLKKLLLPVRFRLLESSGSDSDLSDNDLDDEADAAPADEEDDREDVIFDSDKKQNASEENQSESLVPADEYGASLGQVPLRGKKSKAAWKDEADREVRVKDVTKTFRYSYLKENNGFGRNLLVI